jgi:MtN3 and saliva related transmembrane protein
MITVTHLGLLAGALTSIAGIPQVIHVYRTKKVRDLSIWQPILLSAGIFLWLVYGLVINDIPLIVADIISLVCCLTLLGMILRYRGDDSRTNDDYSMKEFSETGREHETDVATYPGTCDAIHCKRLRVQHDAGQ